MNVFRRNFFSKAFRLSVFLACLYFLFFWCPTVWHRKEFLIWKRRITTCIRALMSIRPNGQKAVESGRKIESKNRVLLFFVILKTWAVVQTSNGRRRTLARGKSRIAAKRHCKNDQWPCFEMENRYFENKCVIHSFGPLTNTQPTWTIINRQNYHKHLCKFYFDFNFKGLV